MAAGSSPLALVATAAGAAVAAFLAYRIVGFLGVAILGVLIAFIAIRIELERDAPFGGEQTGRLIGHIAAARERRTKSEQAADRAAARGLLNATTFAKAIGAFLAAIGAAGFFFLQSG